MALKKTFLLLLLFFLFGESRPLFSQTQTSTLKAKRQKLEQEIAYTNKLIKQVNQSRENTLYELRLINKRMHMRQQLVAVLRKEILALSDSITATGVSLKSLDQRLNNLKKEYAQIAWYLYKNDNNYNRLMFLFSASSFNQAYQRLRYLDEIAAYIRKEAQNIARLEKIKKGKLTRLNNDKNRKKQLLDNQTTQLSQLQLEHHQKMLLQKKLSKKQKLLRARLRQKQKESQKLEAQIKKAIARAAAAAAAAKSASKKVSASETHLSSTFAASKGHLPWPVKNGVISQTFGIHNHPVLTHVQIKNNGINIATAKGMAARAVFPGKVVNVIHITNTNIAIILKHGSYFTVYSGLDKVFVKTNQQVQRGQALGIVHTNLQGKTELHFEVWHNKLLQNPAYWLVKNAR